MGWMRWRTCCSTASRSTSSEPGGRRSPANICPLTRRCAARLANGLEAFAAQEGVELGDGSVHHLLEVGQLCVQLAAQHFVDLASAAGGRIVAFVDHRAERIKLLLESVRPRSWLFEVNIDQLCFNRAQPFFE